MVCFSSDLSLVGTFFSLDLFLFRSFLDVPFGRGATRGAF